VDGHQFDDMARALATGSSRRTLLRRLGGVLGGALALGTTRDLAAQPSGRGGQPQGRCQAGFTNCRGKCVDLRGDNNNCGACATTCPNATVCRGGTCVCPTAGETYVGGVCYDLANDPLNCGSVGEICPGSTPYCVNEACVECLGNSDCATGACQGNACLCVEKGASGCDYNTNPNLAFEDCCLEGNLFIFCNPSRVCGGPGAFCAFNETCASGTCQNGACL
jgi:Stigma-specific protein, Stig1